MNLWRLWLNSLIPISPGILQSLYSDSQAKLTFQHNYYFSACYNPYFQVFTSDNRIAKVNLVSDAAVDTNVRYGHNIMGDKTHPLEIDIYFPSLNLGFEYQVIFPANND